jgi:hypothetical protein
MISFENGEYILFTLRRHWFFIVLNALGNIILMLFPLIVYLVLKATAQLAFVSIIDATETALIIFFYALWVLIFWTKFYIFWTDYYLDAWYITNTRIIDIEQKGFFRREISSVRYKRIEDITIEVRGVISTLLDFGRINVQSAAEEQEFNLRDIPRPYAVKEALGRIIEEQTHHTVPTKNGVKEKY